MASKQAIADSHQIDTIIDTIDLAFVLMKSKGRNATVNKDRGGVGYKCKVTKVMVEW